MKTSRAVLLAAVCACGLTGIVQAASADAHEYRIAGQPVTSKVSIAGSISFVWLRGTPFGVGAATECVNGEMTGAIEGAGIGKALLSMRECAVYKPAGCTLAELRVDSLESTLEATPLVESFAPSEGMKLSEFTYQGSSCSLKGKPTKTEGSFSCSLVEAGVEAESHELYCDIEGSHMKWGGKAATIEAVLHGIHVVNGAGEATKQKWSAS
jgi:hypothetical protein